MSLFPGALPAAGTASASDTLAAAGHTSLHNTGADESRALGTKIGTGSSTPVNQRLLRGNGTGTSAWAQADLTTDVTGVLPQANGGTGTTLATGTGKAVYDTSPTISGATLTSSPTITTPTIASFTNSTHNHQNAAGGGTLAAAAITSLDLTNTTLLNPYKFSVYRNAAWNTPNATTAKIAFDTKTFDTGGNFDVVTNNRFVAPINGFYYFSANVNASTNVVNGYTALYKNGAEIKRGAQVVATNNTLTGVAGLLQLVATDYVEVFIFTSAVQAGNAGANVTYFDGFFVSNT